MGGRGDVSFLSSFYALVGDFMTITRLIENHAMAHLIYLIMKNLPERCAQSNLKHR